jgi:vacuolar iron transporter family protein
MDTHLHHEEKHLGSSDLLTNILIGMSDGLIVPFVLATGLSSSLDSNSIIVVAVIIVIAAGSILLGFGGYLAAKTETHHYTSKLKREYEEIETIRGKEKEEVKTFFSNIGLSKEMQEKAAEEISKDKKQWVDFMMKYELGLDKPDPKKATKSALNIGLSYAVGGLVPLSPYLFTDTPIEALKFSVLFTLICLFIFGFFKSRITGVNPWWGAIRTTMIGALAAGAAFGVAKLFEG